MARSARQTSNPQIHYREQRGNNAPMGHCPVLPRSVDSIVKFDPQVPVGTTVVHV